MTTIRVGFGCQSVSWSNRLANGVVGIYCMRLALSKTTRKIAEQQRGAK